MKIFAVTDSLLLVTFKRRGHICEHILNENAVACGGVVEHHMGDGADKLAVLDYRRA